MTFAWLVSFNRQLHWKQNTEAMLKLFQDQELSTVEAVKETGTFSRARIRNMIKNMYFSLSFNIDSEGYSIYFGDRM